MKRYAFVRRRVVEQEIWIVAESVDHARRKARTGESDEQDDERTLRMALRRMPDHDE